MADDVDQVDRQGQDRASQDARESIRPLVARRAAGNSALLFAAVLLAAGGGVFYALQMRRLDVAQSSLTSPQAPGDAVIVSPPELTLPPAPDYAVAAPVPLGGYNTAAGPGPVEGQEPVARLSSRRSSLQTAMGTPVTPDYTNNPPAGTVMPAVSPAAPSLAYQALSPEGLPQSDKANGKAADGRVSAHQLVNPSTTVPQGSVIQAVMETALDSTRAGFARAIVSHDVRGFDGSRVLIPRGSRLFGSYQSDVSSGQKRALIQWQRLTRPDGSIIDLDSPSADPLGRAGVKGKVNSHFFQRYSSAILQSLLDIGVRRASQVSTGDTIVVGLSNTSNSTTSTLQGSSDIKPTLKIAQGASISVFAARDLDFTAVE